MTLKVEKLALYPGDVFRAKKAFARNTKTTASHNKQNKRCLHNAHMSLSHRPWQHEYVRVGNQTQRITASSRTCSKDATSQPHTHAKNHEITTRKKIPFTGWLHMTQISCNFFCRLYAKPVLPNVLPLRCNEQRYDRDDIGHGLLRRSREASHLSPERGAL